MLISFLCAGDEGSDGNLATHDRERHSKRTRGLRAEKLSGIKDMDHGDCAKKPIISVVLTAHEAIPGKKD